MAPRLTRRDYLRGGACATGLALAGCVELGRSDGASEPGLLPSGSASLAPGETYETGRGWSLTVGTVRVRDGVVAVGSTHPDPLYADEGEQFVVADATVAGDGAPDPGDLDLFAETDTRQESRGRYVRTDPDERGRRQRYAFPVPASPRPEEGAVVWRPPDADPVRWTLPETVLNAVAAPPRFELHEFEVDDAPGDDVEVKLTVGNTGEGDGLFLAEVGHAAVSDQPEVRVGVAVGEIVTARRRVWAPFDGRDELPVVLRWRGGTVRRTVTRR